MSKKRHSAGGQAVIEGVMMRTADYLVVAVRKPEGNIKIKSRKWITLFPRMFKKPFLRGMLVLYEAMFNGIEALTWSFNESVEEENEQEKLTPITTFSTIALAFLFSMLLFVAIPHGAAYLLETFLMGESSINSIIFHTLDGIIKIIIFTLYLWILSKLPDVKRLFKYHGAEHKAIFTMEKGEDLTIENATLHSTHHPRCGTSFMITVIVISILFFTIFFSFFPPLTGNRIIDNVLYVFIKILLVFPIGGISYELQRLASRFPKSNILKILIAPGMWYQHITTTEPPADVLEIGLTSLSKALWLQKLKIDLPREGIEEQFTDYQSFLKSLNREEASC